MRKTEGAIVCPHCGKLIDVNEPRCPYCGAWRPGMFGYAPALQHLFGNRLDLIGLIVISCVVLYVGSLALDLGAVLRSFLPGPAGNVMGLLFNLLAPSSRALFQLGMTGGIAWQEHWWWTLLTATYLHGSLLHIFFNVMWIRNLGPTVTEVYGPARAFVIFNIAGAVGFLVSNLASGGPTIGASGAIFGLLAALIVYGRKRGAAMMTRQLWQWAIVLFVMGFVMSAVNNWAHVGGFAGGWVAAEAMRFSDEKRESPAVLGLALVLIALTLLGVVLSFVKVTALLMAR